MHSRFGITGKLLQVPVLALALALALVLACALGAACALVPCGQAQAALAGGNASMAASAPAKASAAASVRAGGVVKPAAAKPANVKGKANTVRVFTYGWVGGVRHTALSKKNVTLDATGDAKRDSLCVSAERAAGASGSAGLLSRLVVKVNGRVACTVDGTAGRGAGASAAGASTDAAGIDIANVSVVTLRGGQPFLYVSAYRTDGLAFQALYQCANGSFRKVFGNDLLQRAGTSDVRISQLRPVADRVVAHFDFCSALTGHTRTSFAWRWKAGKLSRMADTSSALRYATGANGEFTRRARTAARSLAAYKTTSLAARSFTAKAGASVRPLAVRLQGARLLYKVACGKKTGWVDCASALPSAGGALLRGVSGAVPLSQAAPAYSNAKAYSATALQKLGNHALYLARNEVYARHGLAFSTAELAAHFAGASWYAPRSSGYSTLNKTEKANVALILAIERNRKSPYVQ